MPAPSTAPAPIYDRLVDEHGDVLADAREAAHKAERTAEGVLDFGHAEAPGAQQAPQPPQPFQDQPDHQAPQPTGPDQTQAPQGQQHAPQAPHFPQALQAQQPPAPTQEG
ncbi:hypothetical protein ACFYWS_16610 [Streptomyces sp. NPDC002795]|uniref:hypothetical protein n=1 Tax=Streptomyces sp. NPDC002795 TaxID=3364665 RepID=UPI0036832C7F